MKIIYLFKRIKLENQYNNNLKEVQEVMEKIKSMENNYDYVDENIQTYYDYELIILKEKYSKMLKDMKTINKEIEEIQNN